MRAWVLSNAGLGGGGRRGMVWHEEEEMEVSQCSNNLVRETQ